MTEHFTAQLKNKTPKVFYFVLDDITDINVSITMYSIDTSEIETLTDKYEYVETRNSFPYFKPIYNENTKF